jgi:hypothetical protein
MQNNKANIEDHRNSLFQICKGIDEYNIIVKALKQFAVINEDGQYLLSQRKNQMLFTCIIATYEEYRALLKRNFSQKEMLVAFNRFLNLKTPPVRVNKESNLFNDFKSDVVCFITKELKAMNVSGT